MVCVTFTSRLAIKTTYDSTRALSTYLITSGALQLLHITQLQSCFIYFKIGQTVFSRSFYNVFRLPLPWRSWNCFCVLFVLCNYCGQALAPWISGYAASNLNPGEYCLPFVIGLLIGSSFPCDRNSHVVIHPENAALEFDSHWFGAHMQCLARWVSLSTLSKWSEETYVEVLWSAENSWWTIPSSERNKNVGIVAPICRQIVAVCVDKGYSGDYCKFLVCTLIHV